jgi:UDP-2,4-diacetamido-2,4,6-trideoxy-beta-L-altropyranose hydrolase
MVRLRRATDADTARLYAWHVDPDVRAGSLTAQPATFQQHCEWVARTAEDDRQRLYVARDDSQERWAGMVRLDRRKDEQSAEVSIAVAPGARGRGYANEMLTAAVDLARQWGVERLTARVKTANLPSLRAFWAVNFRPEKHDLDVVHLALSLKGDDE